MRASEVDAARAVGSLPIEYERDLVEEAVLLAVVGRPEERAFRARRDAIYAVPDPEGREAHFDALHTEWFASLGLARPIRGALDELPVLAARARVALVGRALSRGEEGADLLVPHGAAGDGRSASVAIRIRPDRFADPEGLTALLRRELLFVADMLDPEFGYSPDLPKDLLDRAPRRLIEERYRALWEAYVASRLAVGGSGPGDAALAPAGPTTHASLLATVRASLSAAPSDARDAAAPP